LYYASRGAEVGEDTPFDRRGRSDGLPALAGREAVSDDESFVTVRAVDPADGFGEQEPSVLVLRAGVQVLGDAAAAVGALLPRGRDLRNGGFFAGHKASSKVTSSSRLSRAANCCCALQVG
jgi:hypothetical protein